jgi:hypothetical protein
MPRFGQCFCIATIGVFWLTAAAHAQVDWSELLDDQGGEPAADIPRETVREEPTRMDPASAPAPPAPRELRRPRSARRAQPTPARAPQTGTPRPSRRLAADLPEEEREFPVAPRARRR